MPPATRTVALLLFGSGMAALVYQTAWQRMLRLVFGASTAASAAVIALFLGGLGVGGIWLGKRAERTAKPLEFYGTLEAGVAVCAGISPLLVLLAEKIYFGAGGSARLGLAGATVLRVLLALLVMGPAVVLMGGTLPAAARSVESTSDRARSHLAFLYATNTAGAVVGALLGTFLLFELFGTQLTLWVAALLNLLVALLARAIGRGADPVPITEPTERGAAGAGAPQPTFTPQSLFVYTMAALVGFAFVALELVWYRMLGPVLGGSSFTFGLILAVALAGIGIGGYLYSRRAAETPVTLTALAGTLALEALCVAIPLALGDRIAFFAAYTRSMAALGFPALVTSWTLISMAVVFPASVVAGYQFPVLFALLGQGRDRVARQVGLAYAFNTLGSIAGALLVGFVLIPRLGAVASWRAMVVLLAVLFAATLIFALVRGRRRPSAGSALALVTAAVALLCLRSEGPTAAWRHAPIGAGRAEISTFDRNQLRDWQLRRTAKLLWERDGVESSVALDVTNGPAFIVNGKSDGAVVADRGTQGGLGLLLTLLHPNPQDGFVLGLGTGMTAGYMAAVPGIRRVDVAELEPAIIEVARASSAANANALGRRNLHVFLGDGREFLLTTEQRYDVIASEPSNPYRAGIASLFTVEFYRAAAGRLKPGGLFGQWLQGYEVDVQTVRSVVRTLRQVFPFVELWNTQGGDLLLLASQQELTHDAERMRQRLKLAPFADRLPRIWLVEDAEGIFSHFLANAKFTRLFSEAYDPEINTDDNAVLEYAFARNVGIQGMSLTDAMLRAAFERQLDKPRHSGALDWKRVIELRARAWLINPSGGLPQLPGSAAVAKRQEAVSLACHARFKSGLTAWRDQPDQTPRDVIEHFALGAGVAGESDRSAFDAARALEQRGFRAEAELIRARYYRAAKQDAELAQTLFRALAALRTEPLLICSTADSILQMLVPAAKDNPDLGRRFAEALLVGPFSAYINDDQRRSVLHDLGARSKDPRLCVRTLGRDLLQPLWQNDFLRMRYDCLLRAKHPLAERAAQDLQEFLSNTAGRVDVGMQP